MAVAPSEVVRGDKKRYRPPVVKSVTLEQLPPLLMVTCISPEVLCQTCGDCRLPTSCPVDPADC